MQGYKRRSFKGAIDFYDRVPCKGSFKGTKGFYNRVPFKGSFKGTIGGKDFRSSKGATPAAPASASGAQPLVEHAAQAQLFRVQGFRFRV